MKFYGFIPYIYLATSKGHFSIIILNKGIHFLIGHGHGLEILLSAKKNSLGWYLLRCRLE